VESISKVLRRREKAEEKTQEMTDVQLTRQNVRKKIRKLRSAAAAWPDWIGTRVFQEQEKQVIDGLAMIFSEVLW
jgi:hypothetical protein